MNLLVRFYLGIGFVLLCAPTSVWAVIKISKVEFIGKSQPNQILVTANGPIEYEKIDNTADKQVILELKNAKLANKNAGRRLDTSSFNSKVTLISPYQVDGQDTVRIIVQFRDAAELELKTAGNRLIAGVDGSPDSALAESETASDDVSDSATKKSRSKSASVADTSSSASTAEPEQKDPSNALSDFEASAKTKEWVGRRITLQFRDTPVVDVFKLISEASGFNIILASGVGGNLSLSLVDVPWDQALDTILNILQLGAEKNGNILRIATLNQLNTERNQALQSRLQETQSSPRITRIFPISYADPGQLLSVLQRFASPPGGGAAASLNRDFLMIDQRTNSIIIQDTAESINRMAKMIELLDVPTPQVQIEAKIVEANENGAKSIGGAIGGGSSRFDQTSKGSSGGYAGIQLAGGAVGDPSVSNAVTSATTSADGNSSPSFGLAGGLRIAALANFRVNAFLNLIETEGKIRTVSSPKTVVLNRQRASITQGTPVLVPVSVQTGLGTVGQGFQVSNASLSLSVSPTVTNDGSVLMDLSVSSDTSQPLGTTGTSGVANRSVNTRVVTESGSTLVIGGVYTEREAKNEKGIPLLRKIPLLGMLFGSEEVVRSRSELFIFITPRILNEKESSGTVAPENPATAAGESSPNQG